MLNSTSEGKHHNTGRKFVALVEIVTSSYLLLLEVNRSSLAPNKIGIT